MADCVVQDNASGRDILRRSAAYLQNGNTLYFSNAALLEAIVTMYRLADQLKY